MEAAEGSFLTKALRTKLVENVYDVVVQRQDPNSPLYSVKSFEELPLCVLSRPALLKALYAMGFNRPSKIQEHALPLLLADPPKNLIAQSQSGTGKTAAFVLAMLSRIDPTRAHPQVICLFPTFDLAQQTGDVLKQMAKFSSGVTMTYALCDERVQPRVLRTEHIIIGTPYTLLDWIQNERVIDPNRITMFVLDEADIMIDQQKQRDQIIRIQKQLPNSCQKALFLATYSDEVMRFAETVIPNPTIIRSLESLDNTKLFYVECHNDEEKFQGLTNLYGAVSIGQAVVFCQTPQSATWLARKMSCDGHAVALITGVSTIEQRITVLNRVREGKERVLIMTNRCARGMHIDMPVVVNYDIPVDAHNRADCEAYLHRTSSTGLTINFVDSVHSMQHLQELEQYLGRNIPKLTVDDPDLLEQAVSCYR